MSKSYAHTTPVVNPEEPQLYCDGERIDSARLDRGLEFGDGCFETLKIFSGQLIDWPAHYERLQHTCHVLSIHCPDSSALLQLLPTTISLMTDGICKIIVTRGQGGTGYAVSATAKTRVYVLISSKRRVNKALWVVGLLNTQSLVHPTLAGLKTLNRLDSVLARIELNQHPSWDDGLMTDGRGQVVSASLGNVFFCLHGHEWVTPELSDSGIAGCVRRRLIERWPASSRLVIRPVHVSELVSVTEAFVTNSLLPIQTIAQLLDFTLTGTSGADMARELLGL